MVTQREVRVLVDSGASYEDVGRRLGVHPGLAYMIATGLPADGSAAWTAEDEQRPGFLTTSTQYLANPEHVHNPTHHDEVQEWIHARVRRDAQMQAAGASDWPKPPQLGDTGDDADVISLLARDHNGFHKLASRLKYTPSVGKGATHDQIAERAAIVEAIRAGLQRHEAAEQQHLWPFVREKLANGNDVADDAQQQEKQGDEILRALEGAAPDSKDFEDLVEKLQHALRSHVAFEDRVLLALKECTADAERAAVGEQLAATERSSDGSA